MGAFSTINVQEECSKAARTLESFLTNGKIPANVITEAKGLAIFRAFRAGMYFAGTAGTGIVTARLPDGTWSPPSVFSVKAGSIGIVYGIDVYDCVCVLNSAEAVEAYQKSEMRLGGGASFAAGPVSGMTSAKFADKKPVWVYTKSRGIYGGVTLDSTIIKEVPEANADFYGTKVTAAQILRGETVTQEITANWSGGVLQLLEMLRKLDDRENKVIS